MSQESRRKYYAVKIGKEGPQIYGSWNECKKNVKGYPGATHKSFLSLEAAEEWLAPVLNGNPPFTKLRHMGHGPGLSHKTSSSATPPAGDESEDVALLTPSTSIQEGSTEAVLGSHRPGIENTRHPPPGSHGQDATDPIRNSSESVISLLEAIPIVLSDEQQRILARVKSGQNVFFTGSAGTGKSILLREIIKTLRPQPNTRLAVTASTGVASVNIGGTTLHSWAGIGLGQESGEVLVKRISEAPSSRKTRERWMRVRCLIIDEISMIDGTLFDKLEYIGRRVKGNDKPFGGIQLVISGDFFQLPPVPDQRDDAVISSTFAFDAKTWNRCMGIPATLTRVFRQRDQGFVNMLNSMRFGKLDPDTIAKFVGLSRPVEYSDGIGPTELYPTKDEVEGANKFHLDQIEEKAYKYNARDERGYDNNGRLIPKDSMTRKLDSRLVVPKSVSFKVGAQVMLIKNMRQGVLVNGSTGVVIGFRKYPDVATDSRTVVGQGDHRPVSALATSNHVEWPLVRFTNGLKMLCVPEEFTVDNSLGGIEAKRTQVPLILAWALSMHKAQGQTLQRVKIDMRRTFEKGQAYVALSRATSLDSLQVLNFDPLKVVVHPRVLSWHCTNERSTRNSNEEDFRDMDDQEAIASYFASTSTTA